MTDLARVGIVIVSYNASLAIRATLASVRQATNEIPYELILVDNASSPDERNAITQSFFRQARLVGDRWRFIQQESNLGFSGGNNAGIREFVKRDDITHVCLLNGDVIVTDHWLDRLVGKNVDIVSAVTNKADADQCVPITYDLSLADCLDTEREELRLESRRLVTEFAEFRNRTWCGSLLETDVTFFCVLLSVAAVRRIGLLDERFFPGGYEDNDYCLRARAAGISIHLARDVFIHHWGSASFGQLPPAYFAEHASRNIQYLEGKHGIRVRRHPEFSFASYAADMQFVLGSGRDATGLLRYHRCFRALLDPLANTFDAEFKRLCERIDYTRGDLSQELVQHIASARSRSDLAAQWKSTADRVEAHIASSEQLSSDPGDLSVRLNTFVDAVRDVTTCNLEMREFLDLPVPVAHQTKRAPIVEPTSASNVQKALWLVSRGARFLWNLRGVVFFGGYPYPERLSDGYFQRVRMVDSLFRDRWRVYVESAELPGRDRWFDRPEDKVLVLRVRGGPRRRIIVRALAVVAALRCRRIYFHSVLRMRESHFGRLMHIPWLRKVIDIHGVVPEEFRLHNDFYSAVQHEAEEQLAVRKGDLVIVVSDAMHSYLRQKYRDRLHARVAVFPMLPLMTTYIAARPYRDGRPTVVYAGGVHKWQQVPKMVDAIIRTQDLCLYEIYCPEPDVVREMLPEDLRKRVVVEAKAHYELMGLYEKCHFGFLLREDVVVNHVACPTKAVEYLAKGIVPIVDSERVGDFVELGMRFVRLTDFVSGRMPSEAERNRMARENLAVFRRLQNMHETGRTRIVESLEPFNGAVVAQKIRQVGRSLFPSGTARGQLARIAWSRVRRSPEEIRNRRNEVIRAKRGLCKAPPSMHADILMQVDNFEAGGLENVVLHLCEVLRRMGRSVVLLILGNAGPAAEQARKGDIPVVILKKEMTEYESLLGTLRPGLALTHFSTFGASACAAKGIPFVQVIHNAYTWLSPEQLNELRQSACYTRVFVAVSEYAKRYSVERLGLPEAQFVVIPNGAELRAFAGDGDRVQVRDEKRRELGIGKDEFVFLSVGSVSNQKNHISEVRAFAAAADRLPDARLVILGPVHNAHLLEEIDVLIAERALGNKVIYAGAAASACSYLFMADAFVSAAYFEGGQLTLLEAVSANLPVIATRVGFAEHFEGLPGFEVLAPAVDLMRSADDIVEMESPADFVDRLSAAMVRVRESPRRPDFPREVREAMDTTRTYQKYSDLVRSLLKGESWDASSGDADWVRMVEGLRGA